MIERVKIMKNELKIKKCTKCGLLMKVMSNCVDNECETLCCGKPMMELKANAVDAAPEKHVPIYEIKNDCIEVKVNHVMEVDHWIEWICLKTEKKEAFVYLNPSEDASAVFKNVKSGVLYAYCNKHGLWKTEIDKL